MCTGTRYGGMLDSSKWLMEYTCSKRRVEFTRMGGEVWYAHCGVAVKEGETYVRDRQGQYASCGQ